MNLKKLASSLCLGAFLFTGTGPAMAVDLENTIPFDYNAETNNLFFAGLPEHNEFADTVNYQSEKYFMNPELYQAEVDCGTCTSQWGYTWNAMKPWTSFAYPNMDTAYWFYSIDRIQADGSLSSLPIIQLKGEYAHSRYYSFNMYDNTAGFAVGDGFLDKDITPDAGSVNPFVSGVNREATNRSFTLWYVPEGHQAAYDALVAQYGAGNVLTIPDDIVEPAIALRVYLMDGGYNVHGQPTDETALPEIRTFDPNQTTVAAIIANPVACPKAYNMNKDVFMSRVTNDLERMDPLTDIFKEVHFIRAEGGGQWPTVHNVYAAAMLRPYPIIDNGKIYPGLGEIVDLHFRVPKTPKTLAGGGTSDNENVDMRYWSLSMNNFDSTIGMRAINDETAATYTDENGNEWVHLVVGPNKPEVEDFIKNNMTNVNYLPYDGAEMPLYLPGNGTRIRSTPMLLHRNLVLSDGFQNGYNSAELRPEGVHGEDIKQYAAKNYIGDFAPQGFHMTFDEFQKKYKNNKK